MSNIDEKLAKIKAVRCSNSNERWFVDGEIVCVDRKPIDYKRNSKPMYTTKIIKESEK